jgi:hypothetical protein
MRAHTNAVCRLRRDRVFLDLSVHSFDNAFGLWIPRYPLNVEELQLAQLTNNINNSVKSASLIMKPARAVKQLRLTLHHSNDKLRK